MRLILIVFLLTSLTLKGQNSDLFFANASSLEVPQNTSFRVEFVMNNIKGSAFTPPSFQNFQIISGPSQTSSYSNNNGKVSQKYIYSYTLQGSKVGQFTIGSASCVHQGKTLKTAPLSITISKRDAKSLANLGLPSDEDIFVRLELSKDTAYMGEKVELTFKLYTRKEVRSYDIKKESDYSGFFVKPQGTRNRTSTQEEVDGKMYSTQILEKRLLFPQQTGKFTFDAAQITLGLPDPTRRRNGFFFNSGNKAFPVVTNNAVLNVIDLPSDAPASFSGAVGKYTMEATVDKQKLSTDDALTLTIRVAGNGDAKYILPSSQEHLQNFEVYDPNIIERGEREMFGEMQTIKEFEYLVVPKRAGRQNIQARFSYFDTDRNEFVTLRSQAFPLMVEQGTASRQVDLETNDSGNRSLSGRKEKIVLRKKSGEIFGGIGHLTLLAISALGIGFIFWKKRQIDLEAGIDPEVKKRLQARSVADKRLSEARKMMEGNQNRSFYEEISKSILGFIADKLNVPNSEITKNNVAARLEEQGITQDQIQDIKELLSKCEMAIFAGKQDEDLQPTYEKAKQLIDHLSEKI